VKSDRDTAAEALANQGELPTRRRFGVLGMMGSLAFILYLDRVCIGQAATAIQRDLVLSKTEFGYALGAFTIAYGLFEVPTGHWGDRYGSRGVLTRIVIWWSAFTAFTGMVTGLWTLVAVRFLFGAGEAGAYPNVARIIAHWFPRRERGRAQGLVITAAQIGGAVAPIITAYTIVAIGWRSAFVVYSVLGVAWAMVFYLIFRDNPADDPGANQAEVALISADAFVAAAGHEHPKVPWRSILTNRNIWLLGTLQSCSSFLSYMFMGWYPAYLEQGRGVDPVTAGQMSSVVLAGAAVGCLGSGFINDYLARLTNFHPARFRIYGFTGTALAAVLLVISTNCESAWASSIWASLAFMAAVSQQATFWAVTTEIGGRHLGVVFGLMNSMGVPGATISSMFLGRFVDGMQARGFEGRAQWDPAFYIYAAVLLVGAICWTMVNANKKIPDEDPPR
jgi:sugar phosphate permease